MNERNTFKLYFYINSGKEKKDGESPILLRITINQKAVTLSIKRSIKKEFWNAEAGLARDKGKEFDEINRYIDAVRAKAYQKFTELTSMHEIVTPEILRDAILGLNSTESKMLMEIWKEHNDKRKELIGKQGSYSVWQKHHTCFNYFLEFLEKKENVKDVSIKNLDRNMVLNFEHYLKSECACGFNTSVKYLQKLKSIIRNCQHNGWIKHDPFTNIKLAMKDGERAYLDEQEVKQLLEKDIPMPRMSVVRDIFVFSCFTGLSYSDIRKLNKAEIEIDADGSWWIRSKRQKTGVRANIPLLEIPISILNKYCCLEDKNETEPLLPVSSNQKVNAYLKEVAELCGIKKMLTFHCARHTFATTITLTHGVPIESVSKMLGHKNIKQTQLYARIVDVKVGEDMKILSQKHGTRFQFSGMKK